MNKSTIKDLIERSKSTIETAAGDFIDKEDQGKINKILDNLGHYLSPNPIDRNPEVQKAILPDIEGLIREVNTELTGFKTSVDTPDSYSDLDFKVGASLEALVFALVAFDMRKLLRPGRGADYFVDRIKSICSGKNKQYEHAYVVYELQLLLKQIKAAVIVSEG
jgi:hypothetical protein